jgi:hypothetical protein
VSTIEVASQHAGQLLTAFHDYFADAVAHPGGEFKAYYIRNDSTGDRLERLKVFLGRNKIEWANVPAGSYLGLNYETGRMSAFKVAAGGHRHQCQPAEIQSAACPVRAAIAYQRFGDL